MQGRQTRLSSLEEVITPANDATKVQTDGQRPYEGCVPFTTIRLDRHQPMLPSAAYDGTPSDLHFRPWRGFKKVADHIFSPRSLLHRRRDTASDV